MRRRLPMVGLFAASAMAIAFSLFRMVWFRTEFFFGEVEIRLLGGNTDGISTVGPFNWFCLVAGLAAVYYTLRLVFMAVTLLANTPISHTVAWLSPRSAYVQGGIVLLLAAASIVVTPSAHISFTHYALDELVREWAAPAVLLGGIAVSLVGMVIVARVPELAKTQGWVPAPPAEEGLELLADIEPMRRERPMTRPPPVAVAAVDANPMRAPPVNDLRAKTVKTAREADAPPIVDDPDSPKPKFLA